MLAQEGLGSPDQASLLGDPNRQKPASIPATGATGFHLYENQHISFVGNQIQLAPRAAPPLGQDLPALLTEILPHPALADVACILEGSPSGQGIHKKSPAPGSNEQSHCRDTCRCRKSRCGCRSKNLPKRGQKQPPPRLALHPRGLLLISS